jgi:arsenate reductase-like glutaredoxin family protein
MYLNHNEITVLYHKGDHRSKQMFAYLSSFSIPINKQNITDQLISKTLLEYILSFMPEEVEEVIDKRSKFYKNSLKLKRFSVFDWASIIKKNPTLLKHPIIAYNHDVVVCYTPTDIYKIFRQSESAA